MTDDGGPVLVLGIGNILLRDEGVGVHVARALTEGAGAAGGGLPPGARVVDGGTLGLDLLPLIEDAGAVLIVDAATMGREPGTVAVLRGDDLFGAIGGHISPHQIGLGDLLGAARLAGSLPERIALVAIEPAEVAPGLELSPAVAAALPIAIERTVHEAWALFPGEQPAAGVAPTSGPALAGDPGPVVRPS